jgi:DNA-binding MarR family transcriptional regulator
MSNEKVESTKEGSQGQADRSSRATTAAATEPKELLASTGFLLARLGMESRKRFARMMAQHDLSTHHFGLLVALGEHRALPQQQLGQIMGVDPRNAVPIIDELEARELITRQPDPQDRRRYNVALTAAGRKLIRDLRQSGAKLEQEMLTALSDSEQSSLHALLLKLFVAMRPVCP